MNNPEIQSILQTLGARVPPSSRLVLVGGSALALPKGSDKRSILIGQFGNLEVYVADPYSIALSKLDRGFDTDFDDIVFLIRHRLTTPPLCMRQEIAVSIVRIPTSIAHRNRRN